jgi:hypothetical protein
LPVTHRELLALQRIRTLTIHINNTNSTKEILITTAVLVLIIILILISIITLVVMTILTITAILVINNNNSVVDRNTVVIVTQLLATHPPNSIDVGAVQQGPAPEMMHRHGRTLARLSHQTVWFCLPRMCGGSAEEPKGWQYNRKTLGVQRVVLPYRELLGSADDPEELRRKLLVGQKEVTVEREELQRARWQYEDHRQQQLLRRQKELEKEAEREARAAKLEVAQNARQAGFAVTLWPAKEFLYSMYEKVTEGFRQEQRQVRCLVLQGR